MLPVPTSHRVLKQILQKAPHTSLNDIRLAHPAFRSMSMDQLGLHLSRALEELRSFGDEI